MGDEVGIPRGVMGELLPESQPQILQTSHSKKGRGTPYAEGSCTHRPSESSLGRGWMLLSK